MPTPGNYELVQLGDTNLTVLDPAMDIRHRRVLDNNGNDIGHVDDLIIDNTEKRVRFIRVVDHSFLGIGGRKFLIPVDAISNIQEHTIRLARTREDVTAGPLYNPELMDRGYLEQIYGYYGLMPFWGVGYVYPSYPFYL